MIYDPKLRADAQAFAGSMSCLINLLLFLFSVYLYIVLMCVLMYSLCAYVFVHTYAHVLAMPQCIGVGQMITCRSQLSFSTTWILGLNSGL